MPVEPQIALEPAKFARVKNITGKGLEIALPDDRSGVVPVDEIFVSRTKPTVLINLVYLSPISIIVGQLIPILPSGGSPDRFSRRQAVLQADSIALDGKIVAATVTEITSDTIFGIADEGYEVRLSKISTFSLLEERLKERRLSPNHEREREWLYINDRIHVSLGPRIREAVRAATLLVGGTPVSSAASQPVATSVMPPAAPPSPYTEILIVDDDLDKAENALNYFKDSQYATVWEIDLDGVQRWRQEHLRWLRTADRGREQDKATADSAAGKTPGPQRDGGPSGEVLALVRMDSEGFKWESVCDLLVDFPDVHIILTHQSASAATAVLQGIQKSQKYQGRIIGAWESGSDVGGLNAILVGQSALSRALTSGPAIPPSPQDAAAEDHSLAEDVRLAFEPLVEAAEYKSRPCAALLFKIHRQHHQVHLVASCGDDKLIKGFRQYLQRLHRSPVRDLAIYRLQSNTDSAKDNEGRYIYFLDAVGGPEQDLSVRGIRPATPHDSPFAFAAFLVSPRKDAFRGNPHLSKKLLGATQRAIEVALATDVYRTRLQRLKEAAERAADFQYMAHEAAGALEQPVDILKRLTGDFVANPDDIGALRRGTLRASAVMKQMLPREQTESASFSPGAVIDDLLQECKAVERDASGIVLKFDGHTLKGARVYGRRLAFECVLRNIVLNALQQIREYCGGKGNVRLQAAFHDEKTGEKLLIVTVSDDGPGIHRSYWEAIFQGGASTRTHGTGLGLVLSRRLVAQAKGTLELTDSCVYSGSTFRIKMPIAEEAEGQSS